MNTAPDALPHGDLQNILQDRLEQLIPRLDAEMALLAVANATLEDIIREADTSQHRRATYSARDRSCYRVGAALEPGGGRGLDDVSLSGLDCLGGHGVALMVECAIEHPDAKTVSELLGLLFASAHGPLIRAWGGYARWHWMQELYVAETEAFLASRAGRDPRASWRRGSATARQMWLIAEIARVLAVVAPKSLLRGQAFDWIRARGGNPRWQTRPPTPKIPTLSSAHQVKSDD